MIWRIFLGILVIASVVVAGSLYVPSVTYEAPLSAQVIATENEVEYMRKIIDVDEQKEPIELFFVGDIMLGRDVENRMKEEGSMYPFFFVKDMLVTPDVTIGNFEGIVNERHIQTPSMTFQFSIRNEYLTQLRDVGFDILSLANNHSFDYGASALSYTRALCRELMIVCGGSPLLVDEYSVHTEAIGDEKITFLFLYALWSLPSDTALDDLFARIEKESTIEIAYVHWGDEYVLVHNSMQEILAQKLIDRGVDVVIGHHPHVVQDIALYKGKPIFYSLGNFIFDQYFSDNVQEGLGIRMDVTESAYTYTLVPFTSKESRNQPRLMEGSERERLFSRILSPLKEYAGIDTHTGVIRVFR